MDELPVPVLDPRNEEQLVVDVLDRLPQALSDRSAGSVIVKVVEGLAAIYGATVYQLNRWPIGLQVQILRLLGIRPAPARPARALVTFSRAGATSSLTIPAGTAIKTGTDANAVRFTTDYASVLYPGQFSVNVDATASALGTQSNVVAGVLRHLDAPIAGIDGVTNQEAARDGADNETFEELLVRAPSIIRSNDGRRAVVRADFESAALLFGGMQRAHVPDASVPGWIDIHLLDSAWNHALDASVLEDVRLFIAARTVLGVRINTLAAPVRWLRIEKFVGALTPGAEVTAVSRAIATRILQWLNPYEPTRLPNGTEDVWEFGRHIYENELVAVCSDVQGLRRLQSIHVRYGGEGDDPETGGEPFVFTANNMLSMPPFSVVRPVPIGNTPPPFEVLP